MKKYDVKVSFFQKPRVSAKKSTHKCTLSIKHSTIQVDEIDLVWGSIYANKDNKVKNFEDRLAYDKSLVRFLFDLKNTGLDLCVNSDAIKVEQTQKTFFMNRLGVILCNIVAKKEFDLKHLNHLQKILKHKGIGFYPKKPNKFPDFIAQKGKDFYLFEAKGTGSNNKLVQEKAAIKQLNSINSIKTKGSAVTPYKLLSQTTLNDLKVEVALIDPEGEGVEIDFGDTNFEEICFNNYKLNLNDKFLKTITIDDKDYKVFIVDDYAIGFDLNYKNFEKDVEISNVSNKPNIINGIGNPDSVIEGRLFNDGTVILKIVDKKVTNDAKLPDKNKCALVSFYPDDYGRTYTYFVDSYHHGGHWYLEDKDEEVYLVEFKELSDDELPVPRNQMKCLRWKEFEIIKEDASNERTSKKDDSKNSVEIKEWPFHVIVNKEALNDAFERAELFLDKKFPDFKKNSKFDVLGDSYAYIYTKDDKRIELNLCIWPYDETWIDANFEFETPDFLNEKIFVKKIGELSMEEQKELVRILMLEYPDLELRKTSPVDFIFELDKHRTDYWLYDQNNWIKIRYCTDDEEKIVAIESNMDVRVPSMDDIKRKITNPE